MMDFAKDTIFKLHKVEAERINKNVAAILIAPEHVIGVYKTIRDEVIFTDHRIIAVDVQDITGKRQEITTIPYSKIQYFGIQTPGMVELIPDAELTLYFADGHHLIFEFRGANDVLEIGREISEFMLLGRTL